MAAVPSRLWSEISPDLRAILTAESLTIAQRPIEQAGRFQWATIASMKVGFAVEAEPTGGGYQYISRQVRIRRGITIDASLNEDEVQDLCIDAQDTLIGAFLYDGNQPEGVSNIWLVEAEDPLEDESNEWIVSIIFRVEYAVDVPQ